MLKKILLILILLATFSASQLSAYISSPPMYFGEEKIVDVNIRRLRMKVEDTPSSPTNIITVWGLGYKWEQKEV